MRTFAALCAWSLLMAPVAGAADPPLGAMATGWGPASEALYATGPAALLSLSGANICSVTCVAWQSQRDRGSARCVAQADLCALTFACQLLALACLRREPRWR